MHSTAELISDFAAGKMIVLLDDEQRENEGDIIVAAEKVTPAIINFMAKHARGLICFPIEATRCQQLGLQLMSHHNRSRNHTNFTVSIEAVEGITTGISVYDRAHTIKTAIRHDASNNDIVSPGHVFPIQAVAGGVLVRPGHTEAAVDFAKLSGCIPAAVIVEVMNEDGTMARLPELTQFAQQHGLKIGTIANLIEYRLEHEQTVERIHVTENYQYLGQTWKLHRYQDHIHGSIHSALVKGDINTAIPLVRVQQYTPVDDLLGVSNTGSWTWLEAIKTMDSAESAVAVLLNFPHHYQKTDATAHASTNFQTYGTGAQILADLCVHKMRLLSSPIRLSALSGFSLEIVEMVAPRSTNI